LQKWGNSSLNVLASLIGVAPASAPTPTKVTLPSPTAIPPTIVPTLASTVVPATPTPGSTAAKTFDDKDGAFAYSSGWQTISTSKAYGGSYKETSQDGDTVTFPFTGQSFSLIYKGGITFSKFDIYVDNALVGTLDQKMGAATYQVRWDYPGQLPSGNHTLKLVFKVTSLTINRGSLDAVIVR